MGQQEWDRKIPNVNIIVYLVQYPPKSSKMFNSFPQESKSQILR